MGVVRTSGNWTASNVEIMHRAYDASSWTTDSDSNGGTNDYGIVASGVGKLFKHNSNNYTGDYDNTYIAHMAYWNFKLNDTQLNGLFNNGKIFDWKTNNGGYTLSGNIYEYFKKATHRVVLSDNNQGANANDYINVIDDLQQIA